MPTFEIFRQIALADLRLQKWSKSVILTIWRAKVEYLNNLVIQRFMSDQN